MDNAGIDTLYFKPYSTHSATVSKTAALPQSLTKVLEMGNWKGTSTFYKFYLQRVKYFKRPGTLNKLKCTFCTVSTNTNKTCHVTASHGLLIPADPVHRFRKFSLHKVLSWKRGCSVAAPYVDLPLADQGYALSLISSGMSDVSEFPADSSFVSTQASSPPSPAQVSGPPSPASTMDTVEDSPLKKPQTRHPRQQKGKSLECSMPVPILARPPVGPVRELTFDNIVRARVPGDLFAKVDNIIQQTMHIQEAPLAAP